MLKPNILFALKFIYHLPVTLYPHSKKKKLHYKLKILFYFVYSTIYHILLYYDTSEFDNLKQFSVLISLCSLIENANIKCL